MLPELFTYEINQLDAVNRELYGRRHVSFQRADGEVLEIDGEVKEEDHMPLTSDLIMEKVRVMDHYVLD